MAAVFLELERADSGSALHYADSMSANGPFKAEISQAQLLRYADVTPAIAPAAQQDIRARLMRFAGVELAHAPDLSESKLAQLNCAVPTDQPEAQGAVAAPTRGGGYAPYDEPTPGVSDYLQLLKMPSTWIKIDESSGAMASTDWAYGSVWSMVGAGLTKAWVERKNYYDPSHVAINHAWRVGPALGLFAAADYLADHHFRGPDHRETILTPTSLDPVLMGAAVSIHGIGAKALFFSAAWLAGRVENYFEGKALPWQDHRSGLESRNVRMRI